MAALAALAGGAFALRPEGYAVNAPLRQLLLGRGEAVDAEEVGSRIRVPGGFELGI